MLTSVGLYLLQDERLIEQGFKINCCLWNPQVFNWLSLYLKFQDHQWRLQLMFNQTLKHLISWVCAESCWFKEWISRTKEGSSLCSGNQTFMLWHKMLEILFVGPAKACYLESFLARNLSRIWMLVKMKVKTSSSWWSLLGSVYFWSKYIGVQMLCSTGGQLQMSRTLFRSQISVILLVEVKNFS